MDGAGTVKEGIPPVRILYPDGREETLTAEEFRHRYGPPREVRQIRNNETVFLRRQKGLDTYWPRGNGVEALFRERASKKRGDDSDDRG